VPNGTPQKFPGSALATAITFDARGERLITTDLHDEVSHIRNATTGEILRGPLKAQLPYRGVFSPDGKTVVVCGWTEAVPFKVENGELAGNILWNDDAVMSAAFSPGYQLLATANYDGSVRLWNARNFRALPINHILEHQSRPEKVAFIDETTLVTHCNDGENYVWNLGTKPPEPSPIPRVTRPDPLHVKNEGVDLSAQGRVISGKIGTTDIRVELPYKVDVIAVSPRKDVFAAGSKDPAFVITDALLYRLSDLNNPIRLNHRDGINHIGFSTLGDKLVTCSEDFSAIIWDARTGRRLTQPMRHSWQVMSAGFSSDDRWLVTAGADSVCIVWNVANGEPLTTPLRFPPNLRYVAFEPGDLGIVTSTRDGDFRMDLPFAELPLREQSKYLEDWIEPTIMTRF
jgi:WD40 repeat protein